MKFIDKLNKIKVQNNLLNQNIILYSVLSIKPSVLIQPSILIVIIDNFFLFRAVGQWHSYKLC